MTASCGDFLQFFKAFLKYPLMFNIFLKALLNKLFITFSKMLHFKKSSQDNERKHREFTFRKFTCLQTKHKTRVTVLLRFLHLPYDKFQTKDIKQVIFTHKSKELFSKNKTTSERNQKYFLSKKLMEIINS